MKPTPLVYRDEGQTIITCIDPALLQEKISSGAYHTILRALNAEGNERDIADRKKFLKQYWGEVFETYGSATLRKAYPPVTNRFYASPKWDSPKARANNEAFDGFLDYGTAVIAIEAKGKYLSLRAKYSGSREILLADLDERFGKAARQLAEKLEIVFHREMKERHGFSQRDERNRAVLQYTPELAQAVNRIYPVVLVQDAAMQIGFANHELRNLFDTEIKGRNVDRTLVKPLSLLTVEDLEYLIPYLDEVSLTEILDEYVKPHEPIFAFKYVLNEYLKRNNIATRPNAWVAQRFEELRESLKDLFTVID
jgi:hypothetical protein